MEIRGWDNESAQGADQGWFAEGKAALLKNKPSEAVKCFGQALKADPFNAGAHRGLGSAYWAQGKTEDALNSLTRALELEPGDRDTVLECSRVFGLLGKKDFSREVLQSYLEKNPREEAVRSAIESLSRNGESGAPPDTAEFFRLQGEIQFERGNITNATACFEMAIENNPVMAEAYSNLGVIYMADGRVNEALELLYKALELKPEDPAILSNSAKALATAGHLEAAIGTYKEYLRRSPEDMEAWDEFESLIRRCVPKEWAPDGLSHDVAEIYIRMAKLLGEAGDYAGAADAVGRSLQIQPAAVEALFVLAALHNNLGHRDEAASILEEALLVDPTHLQCSELLGSIRSANGSVAPA